MIHFTDNGFSRFLGGRTRNRITWKSVSSSCSSANLEKDAVWRTQSDDLLGLKARLIDGFMEFERFETNPSFGVHWENVLSSNNLLALPPNMNN
jgi:hypothetical protein